MLAGARLWTWCCVLVCCLLVSAAQAFVLGSYKGLVRSSFGGAARVLSSSPAATTLAMSGKEIEVVKDPSNEQLAKLGVGDWPTWGCDVSKFPWTYEEQEVCYLLSGEVTVTPSDGRKPATFGKGDLVTFPEGMSCTWDVKAAVSKHFRFG